MELLADYGLFLLQTVTIVLAVIAVIAVSSKISGSGDEPKRCDQNYRSIEEVC